MKGIGMKSYSIQLWGDRKHRHAVIRDTLVPKLLRGKIEVPETEAVAKEVSC